MSESLIKLAKEIDNLVDGFVSKVQDVAAPAPMGEGQADAGNDVVRGAVEAFMKKRYQNTLKKWGQMEQKLSDDEYAGLNGLQKLDLRYDLTMENGKYVSARIVPEIVPTVVRYSAGGKKMGGEATSSNSTTLKTPGLLTPYFQGLAGLLPVVANKIIASRNLTGNSSFGGFAGGHIIFQ